MAVWSRELREAADEIERLRRNTGCARDQRSTQFCAEAMDAHREFEKLRAERDEARRMVCSAYAPQGRDIATERGWDCWKEDNHGR
jgi:predicted DsbA family dithiol-disulfide isomerase